MPDKVRSVDDMVADMEKAVEEPEGNTSSGKHRQHVAQAIEKLISSQIIDGKLRYIEDGTGSKAASKTAPTLLTLAAAVQDMVSEMSGRKMSYTITIEGKAAAAAPKPTGKPRGRPPKDPAGTTGNNNNFTIGSINPTTNGARYRCTVNLNGTQVNLDSTDADGMRYGRRNVVRLIIDGQNYRGRTYQWIKHALSAFFLATIRSRRFVPREQLARVGGHQNVTQTRLDRAQMAQRGKTRL